jgi:quinol-cytochrome oxidoreductase complex cytochrome b subunit
MVHTFEFIAGGLRDHERRDFNYAGTMAVCTTVAHLKVLQGIHYLGIRVGFTGLLKWRQGVPDAIPVIGPAVVELLRGGGGCWSINTTLCFYSLHTLFYQPTAVVC